MSYFLPDLCLPVCLFFPSDSLDLNSHCLVLSVFFSDAAGGMDSLSLPLKFMQEHILSKDAVALLFKECTGEKMSFPHSLPCLPLDSVLPEHPCYIPLVRVPVMLWVINVSTLMTSATSNSLFFFFSSLNFSRGGSKHSLQNNELPLSFPPSPPPPLC